MKVFRLKHTRTGSDNGMLPAGTPEELAGPAEVPTRLSERFATLDALRGFALLGILILNIEDFAGPEALFDIPVGGPHPAFTGWHTQLDYMIVTGKWLLAEGKMRTLFSMLFGASVILLTERIEQRAGPARAVRIFYRRNLWLLFFGVLHGFVVFYGDILVDYALLGLLFLYPLRRLGARSLLVLGLVVSIGGGTLGTSRQFHILDALQGNAPPAAMAALSPKPSQTAPGDAGQQGTPDPAADAELREGRLGFFAGWPHRVSQELDFLKVKFGSGWILEWFGAMIVGMGLYKSGFLTNRRPARDYVLLAAGGYALSWPIILAGLWHTKRAGFSEAADAIWMQLPYSLEVMAGTLANTSVVLLFLRKDRVRRLLSPLSAVGRTALSNYILTSVICQVIFAWGPWALFGRLDFYQWYYVVGGIWVANLTLSVIWLRLFAFGPLEWLWRSLTYWQCQPMRIRQPG